MALDMVRGGGGRRERRGERSGVMEEDVEKGEAWLACWWVYCFS